MRFRAAQLGLLALIALLLAPGAWDSWRAHRRDAARRDAVETHRARAEEAVAAGDFERAEQALRAAATLAPQDPAIQEAIAAAAVRRAARQPHTIGDGEVAALAYAASSAAEGPETLTTLGHLALLRERADEALADYGRAIALDPAYVPAHLGLARVHRVQGAKLQALAALEAAVKAGPKDLQALNDLGVQYLELERLPDAAATLQRALAVQDNPATRLNLATVLDKLDRRAEALEHLRLAAAMAPRSKGVLAAWAGLLERDGRRDEADAVLQRSLALGQDAPTLIALGRIRLGQSRPADAAAILGRVVEADPGAAEAHYWLGNARYSLGEVDAAAESWRRFVRVAGAQPALAPLVGKARQSLAAMERSPAPPAPAPPAPAPQ